jgi:hypothetical protein
MPHAHLPTNCNLPTNPAALHRWLELKAYMASLGYAAAAQAKAAAGGSDFMLAIFYRPDRLRLVWQEERSRVLLAALQCGAEGPAQGQVGGGAHACRCMEQWAYQSVGGCGSCAAAPLPTQTCCCMPYRSQVVWLANVHLEASPYRPNDRISQLRSALQRLEAQFSSRAGALLMAADGDARGHAPRCLLGCQPGSTACPTSTHLTGGRMICPLRSPLPPLLWLYAMVAPLMRHALESTHVCACAEAEAADVIICGDFNSLEQDSPCWLLRQGRLERNHTDAICPQVNRRVGAGGGHGAGLRQAGRAGDWEGVLQASAAQS